MEHGSFAGKIFRDNLYTFSNYQQSVSKKIDEQNAENSKPTLYIKYTGLIDITFDLFLLSRFVDVQTELDDWYNLLDSGTTSLFIMGDLPISYNPFIITNLSIKNTIRERTGKYIHCILNVKLKEKVVE